MGRIDVLSLTDHHLDPKVHKAGIRHNRVMIPLGVHRAWHILVEEKRPECALLTIVRQYLPADEVRIVDVAMRGWSGQMQPRRYPLAISPKQATAFTIVFPTERPLEILKLWAWQWVPRDFLYHLTVVIGQEAHNIPPDQPDTDLIAKIKRRQERKLLELQPTCRFLH